MLTVPEVHFEVFNRHSRTGCVEFTRAVVASDTGKILILQSVSGCVCRVGNGVHGFGIDGGVAHYALERVIGV